MPILFILLLALIIAQIGFWKTLGAIIGAIFMVVLLVILLAAAVAVAGIIAYKRTRPRY